MLTKVVRTNCDVFVRNILLQWFYQGNFHVTIGNMTSTVAVHVYTENFKAVSIHWTGLWDWTQRKLGSSFWVTEMSLERKLIELRCCSSLMVEVN